MLRIKLQLRSVSLCSLSNSTKKKKKMTYQTNRMTMISCKIQTSTKSTERLLRCYNLRVNLKTATLLSSNHLVLARKTLNSISQSVIRVVRESDSSRAIKHSIKFSVKLSRSCKTKISTRSSTNRSLNKTLLTIVTWLKGPSQYKI